MLNNANHDIELFTKINNLYEVLKYFEQFDNLKKPEFLKRNEGYKSFCNIAIWLVLYNMQNEVEQNDTINQIVKKSGKDQEYIKSVIEDLAEDKVMIDLMERYGVGNISLNISPGDYDQLTQNLKENHQELYTFLKENNIISSNSKNGYLEIKMDKTIDFQWNGSGAPLRIQPDEYTKKHYPDELQKYTFDDQPMNYLSAGEGECNYIHLTTRCIQYKGYYWIIVAKEISEKNTKADTIKSAKNGDKAKQTKSIGNALFITPLIPDATNDEIRQILQATDLHELYLKAQQSEMLSAKSKTDEIKFIKENFESFKKSGILSVAMLGFDEFVKELQFPNLENKFIGTELRANGEQTIFAPFCQSINNRAPGAGVTVQYKFKLKYNEHGGQVKNRSGILCSDGDHNGVINYTLKLNQAYIFIYQAMNDKGVSDIYPFMIGDPVKKTITKINNGEVKLEQDIVGQNTRPPTTQLGCIAEAIKPTGGQGKG